MHPLDKFGYCPVCGSRHFEENNFKSKKCRDCGFTYYANPCSATVAFIMNERGQLLVATRAKEPAKGTLDLVGGFVDMGETAEEGLLREIQEETGMSVDNYQYLFSIPNLYEYSGMTIHTLDMFFLVRVPDNVQPKADDDVAELRWMALEDVDYRKFGLHSISQGVKKALEKRLLSPSSTINIKSCSN
ncbi:MAG: NUDIX domain-containing protein [Prevotella sp.]|nr:NUDIX domain-containing protein [Prevotella sp.]